MESNRSVGRDVLFYNKRIINNKKEMKAVVTLSKKFFPAHYRAGQETEFKAKVLAETKKHTCRSNYEYWAKKIAKVKETGGGLSVRQWSEKPYRSPQEIIKDIPADIIGVQKLELRRTKIVANHYAEGIEKPLITIAEYEYTATVDGVNIPVELLAANDGLTPEEYKAWFAPVFDKAEKENEVLAKLSAATIMDFAIIHFTKFRY